MLRTARLLIGFFFLFLWNGLYAQSPPIIQWQKCFGGPYAEQGYSIAPTPDGGYILGASTRGSGGDVTGFHGTNDATTDFWVVKMAADGTIQWQKSLGGTYLDDIAAIRPTPDGGYIVGGSGASSDGDQTGLHTPSRPDYWVVKLDGNGVIQWQKSYGGSADDNLLGLQVIPGGGYVLAGYTSSTDGDVTGLHSAGYDAWIVRIDGNGVLQWQKCLGGANEDRANDIQVLPDGNFVLAGYSASNDGDLAGVNKGTTDAWVAKIDQGDGHIIWSKDLGSNNTDFASALVPNPDDGGVVVAAYTYSAGGGDIPGNHSAGSPDWWLFRLDGSGNLVWNRNYGSAGDDIAYAVDRTPGGDYVFTGYVAYPNGDISCLVNPYSILAMQVKGTDGTLQWQLPMGGQKTQNGRSIRCTPDGGYILTGFTSSSDLPGYHPDQGTIPGDAYVAKLGNTNVTVTVGAPPGTICAGAPTTLTATVNPALPGLVYQWIRSIGPPVPPSSSPSLTASDFANGEQVYCRVIPPQSCATSWVSNVVTITVVTGVTPTVHITASSVDICQGNTVVFNAAVTNGGTSPHYQWLINGSPAAGATDNPTFTTSALNNADVVSCQYTATTGCAQSPISSNNQTIQVNPTVTPSLRLDVTPLSATVCSGQPVSFAADPTNGGVSPNYEWRLNGVAVGSNGPTYTVGNPANGDIVTCLMTSHAYCATPAEVSAPPVTLTVGQGGAASVVVSYTPYPACEGATLTFKAVATGAGPSPKYQWAVNGTPVGTNSPTYTSGSLKYLDNVTCQVSDGTGGTCIAPASGGASVIYYPVPHVNADQKVVISRGQSVVLDLGATGDISTYAWSPATGLSDPAIANPTAQPSTTTEYTLLVTSSAGCTASGRVTVSVVSTLLLPGAFTPNGDGRNDVLYIMGASSGAVVKEFAIFNRLGQRIFSVHNAPPGDRNFGWNGTVNGQPAQAGTYVYEIVLGMADGSQQVYKGTVVLVR